MTSIWKNNTGIKAAFITRNLEAVYGAIRPITSLSTDADKLKAFEINRKIVASFFTIPEIELAMGVQLHGTNIEYVSKTEIHENTDGLVTNLVGVALAVLVADCAALLLADRKNNVVAAAHAGWRGAAAGMAMATVHKMKSLGADPANLECYISPCISLARFEVGEEVADQFPEKFVDRTGIKPHVNLQGFLTAELIDCGIPHNQIVIDRRCTFQNAGIMHSYRRDGKASGRMMAAITLT